MKVIEWPRFLEETSPFQGKSSAVTVGVFDGVHLGHLALIGRIVAHNKQGLVPVVITFRQGNYKKNRVDHGEFCGDVLSFQQKASIFESLGVSVTVVVEFSESFRQMRGTDFFRILLDHGKMSFLAVGSDFRCGYKLDTDALKIKEFTARYNVPTEIIAPLTMGDLPISSSRIRSSIARGEINEAAAMLGSPFIVDLCWQGQVLPPSGSYQVILTGKKDSQKIKKQAEIIIKEGAVIIANELANCASWEYAEFL